MNFVIIGQRKKSTVQKSAQARTRPPRRQALVHRPTSAQRLLEHCQKVIFWVNFRDSLVLSPQPSALTSQHYINTLFSSLPTEQRPHTSSSSSSSTPKDREKLLGGSMEVFPPWMPSISSSTHHPSIQEQIVRRKEWALSNFELDKGRSSWRRFSSRVVSFNSSLCISCFLKCVIPTWEYL